MMSPPGEFYLAHAIQNASPSPELNVGTRVDRNGKTTYHVSNRDRRLGVQIEKVFDQDENLIRISKKARQSQSDTYFDPDTGSVSRIYESSTLPDGSTLTKDIVYSTDERSSEAVIVVSANGELVRKVERLHAGLRMIFQGQTEYDADGIPATSVNHHMDLATGNLMHRQQIQWTGERSKSLTEDFYFNHNGILTRYVKVIYHADAGPFLEETQEFFVSTQQLRRREIAAYNIDGTRTCIDVLDYGESGRVVARNSTFFDQKGNAIATRKVGSAQEVPGSDCPENN